MKPKVNHAGTIYKAEGMDACQTPPYALGPLLPYLKRVASTVWEPFCGEGFLASAIAHGGIDAVISSDIQTGCNFFIDEPSDPWDAIVTNPAYTIKYQAIEHSYALGKPFAHLVPVELLGASKAQAMFERYGVEIILLDSRVDFKMPSKGWDSHAQFPVMWVTWGMELRAPIVYGHIKEAKAEFIREMKGQPHVN